MKQHHNSKQQHLNAAAVQPVHFEFTHPTAHVVCIAGTFNDWHPEAKPMHSTGNGHWVKESALPPGSYEYCLVVDGKYLPDPLAPETVANPFGGRNSVLHVTRQTQEEHLTEQSTAPLKTSSKSSKSNL